MGVSAGDYDRDGWLDIVKTNFDDDTPSLYRNLGAARSTMRRAPAGLGGQHAVSGLGYRVPRRRSRQLAGHLHRQRPCLSGGRSHRRPLQLRAAEAAVPQSRQRALRGCVDARRAGAACEEGGARRRLRRPVQHRAAGYRREQHARRTEPAAQLRAARRPQPCRASWWARARTAARSARGSRCTWQAGGSSTRCAAAAVSVRTTICGSTWASAQPDRADRIEVAWPSGAAETIAGVDADQLVVIREGGTVVRRAPLVRRALTGCAPR